MDSSVPMQIYPRLRGTKPSSSSSGVLTDTANQVAQQLSIVRRLRRQNTRFLDESEKAWVDHVLNSSTLIIDAVGHPVDSGTEMAKPRRRWKPDSTVFHQMRQLLRESPAATDDLTQLLIAAQSLNSAIGLLSCCYDRWKWCQGVKGDQEDTSLGELSELVNRRKHAPATNRLVRLASVCLHEGRTMIDERDLDDKLAGGSGGKRVSGMLEDVPSDLDSTGRHGRLSLVIIETVEKWRQNAEDALSRTSSQSIEEESVCDESNSSVSGFDVGSEDSRSSSSRGFTAGGRLNVIRHSAPPSRNSATSATTDRADSPTRTTSAESHHTPSDRNNLSFAPIYQIPRRKPLHHRPHSTITTSSQTSSSTSPKPLLRPASISIRNSYDKEVVDFDNLINHGRTISSESTGSHAVVSPPLQPYSQPPTQFLTPNHENFSLSSVSPCSSQVTLAPAPAPASVHETDYSSSANVPLPRPNRISRGRAWLEKQAENGL